jgi:putative acetyltransferase
LSVTLDLADESAASPVGAPLVTAQWRELMRRYGVPDDVDATDDLLAEQLAPPHGVFLVGRVGGIAVACGGVRRHDATTGEVKRMYVVPGHRGNGHSRTVLRALEDRAHALGYARLILETGLMQPEAMALYEAEGYRSIAPYGAHRDSPSLRCYEKPL